MKLLIDQNIGKRIIDNIQDVFPKSNHVSNLALGNASDLEIWEYALNKNMVLVSSDAQFLDLSIVASKSPKTIFIKGETITTNKLEWVLRVNQDSIKEFVEEQIADCLTIQA